MITNDRPSILEQADIQTPAQIREVSVARAKYAYEAYCKEALTIGEAHDAWKHLSIFEREKWIKASEAVIKSFLVGI